MKRIIFFGLLLLGQLASAQSGKLLKVPGTKCSLIPPEGFVASSTFSGFQNNKLGASIMINEVAGSYQSIIGEFTAEALKSKEMTLVHRETINFNNDKATLIQVTQPANGTIYLKQILLFGDAKQTILINGIYPQASKFIESQIKDALLSTVYNSSQNDNPAEAASFSINITNTEFKLVKYLSGNLLYSTDGKIPTEKPTLIVGNSIAKIPTQDRKAYAQDRIKKLPRGEQNIVKEINDITIDSLKGYEIIAIGKGIDHTPELVYQLMLFNDKGDYYIIVGHCKEEFKKYTEIFKEVSKTFKRK